MIPVIRKPDGTFACGPEEDREPEVGELFVDVPTVAVRVMQGALQELCGAVNHDGSVHLTPEGVAAFEAWEAKKRKRLLAVIEKANEEIKKNTMPGQENPILEEYLTGHPPRDWIKGGVGMLVGKDSVDLDKSFADAFPDEESWRELHEKVERETVRMFEERQTGPPEMIQSYWRCPHCEDGVTVEHAEGIPDLDVPIPDGWTKRYVADTKYCCGGGVMVRRIALCADCATLGDAEIEARWREDCLTEGWRFTFRTVRETLDWIKRGDPVQVAATEGMVPKPAGCIEPFRTYALPMIQSPLKDRVKELLDSMDEQQRRRIVGKYAHKTVNKDFYATVSWDGPEEKECVDGSVEIEPMAVKLKLSDTMATFMDEDVFILPDPDMT